MVNGTNIIKRADRTRVISDAWLIVHLVPLCDAIRNMRSSSTKNSLETLEARSATKQPAVISRLLYFPATVYIARASPARCHPLRRM